MALPMPEGYAEALAAWNNPPTKADQKSHAQLFTLQGGLKGYSF